MAYNHQHHYAPQQPPVSTYPEHGEYADIDQPAVSDARPEIFPVPHPLFTREAITNSRVYPSSQSPQSWTAYEPQFHSQPLSYPSYPSPSPFPPPRLSPPPAAQTFQFKAPGQSVSPGSASHRLTLAGSLDPATGIFYRTPEHPRLRTAQACEKCRTRKAKCSGEHPSCKRCITRGLICEYAKEGRVRGPNKPKIKANATSTASPGASTSSTTGKSAFATGKSETSPTSVRSPDYVSRPGPQRPPSSHSSGGSSDHTPNDAPSKSLFLPPAPGDRPEYLHQRSSSSSPPMSVPSMSRGHYLEADFGPSPSISKYYSLNERRSPRSHPMEVHLDTASTLFKLSGASIADDAAGSRLASSGRVDMRANLYDLGPGMNARSLPDDTQFYAYQQPSLLQTTQRAEQQGAYPDAGGSHSMGQLPQYQPLGQHHDFQTAQGNVFTIPMQHTRTAQGVGADVHALNSVNIAPPPRRFQQPANTGVSQPRQAYTTQNQMSSHQHFQTHQLVPIPLGITIPAEDSRPTLYHGGRDELSYPQSQGTTGLSYLQGRGYPGSEHGMRAGRASGHAPEEHQTVYSATDIYGQSEVQQQQNSLSGPSQMGHIQQHQRTQAPQAEYHLSGRQTYDGREMIPTYPPSRTASTVTSTSTLSQRGTPVSASASAGDGLLSYHYATQTAPSASTSSRLSDSHMGMHASLSASTSLGHSTRMPQGRSEGDAELHDQRGAGDGGDGETRYVGLSEAVQQQQQRGSAHGSAGDLTQPHETRYGHNPALGQHGYVADHGAVYGEDEGGGQLRTGGEEFAKIG